MTEQWSIHWDGASIGDADAIVVNAADGIGYRMANILYESPFVDRMIRALTNGTGDRGVLNNWLNELAVSGVGTPISIATGAAIDYGLYYENDAVINMAVPSPTTDTRYDRIVIRRDWTAKTARATRLVGVEGVGYAPAMTKSVAPGGTGIYDIPLASLSVTTGGVIAVTDERQFCQFPTEPLPLIFATANLVNEGADMTSRATRTHRMFLGGGDARPAIDAGTPGRFTYDSDDYYLANYLLSVWGSALATTEGWQAVGNDTGFDIVFKMPTDYAGGDVDAYAWWMDDAGAALDWYIRTAYQVYAPSTDATYSEGYTSTRVNGTWAVGHVGRETARSITDLAGNEMIYYHVQFDNLAGAEDVLFLGLELNYTGYL